MQIKVRIFTEVGMYYPDEEPPRNGILSHLTLTQNGFVCEMMFPYDTEIEYYTEPDVYVMLWIGLKDSNGKDIYDGDIGVWVTDHGIYRGKVQRDAQRHGWSICLLEEKGWSIQLMPLADLNDAFCTVIGNIHEDKELLET